MRKETVVFQFKVLFRNFPGELEEDHDNPFRKSGSVPRFDPRTSKHEYQPWLSFSSCRDFKKKRLHSWCVTTSINLYKTNIILLESDHIFKCLVLSTKIAMRGVKEIKIQCAITQKFLIFETIKNLVRRVSWSVISEDCSFLVVWVVTIPVMRLFLLPSEFKQSEAVLQAWQLN